MIYALTEQALPRTETSPVILMVSGGSDSTALLVRAVRATLDLCDGAGEVRLNKETLHVLHINHMLRGEAANADEAFVRNLCSTFGVDFCARRIDVPHLAATAKQSFEEAAREVRYQTAWELALELAHAVQADPATARILVAHTADDRAETTLMRFITGAGLTGLVGIQPVQGIVVRPLLRFSRQQLRDYLIQENISWCEDATNAECDALRSYVRNRVLPPIKERNTSFLSTYNAMISVLNAENDLLNDLTQKAYKSYVKRRSSVALEIGPGILSLHAALIRRVIRKALQELYGPERFRDARIEAGHVDAIVGLVQAKEGSCTLPGNVDCRAVRGSLLLTLPSMPGDSKIACPDIPGEYCFNDHVIEIDVVPCQTTQEISEQAKALAQDVKITMAKRRACLPEDVYEGKDFVICDAGMLGEGTLEIGTPMEGERMVPFGLHAAKLVHDVLADAHIPVPERSQIPVVRLVNSTDSRVIWVTGIRLDEHAAYTRSTKEFVVIKRYGPSIGA